MPPQNEKAFFCFIGVHVLCYLGYHLDNSDFDNHGCDNDYYDSCKHTSLAEQCKLAPVVLRKVYNHNTGVNDNGHDNHNRYKNNSIN